jgi:hypothetical protein
MRRHASATGPDEGCRVGAVTAAPACAQQVHEAAVADDPPRRSLVQASCAHVAHEGDRRHVGRGRAAVEVADRIVGVEGCVREQGIGVPLVRGEDDPDELWAERYRVVGGEEPGELLEPPRMRGAR